jgi:tRNA A-37 threonylcarbamoyl transferase component Bud32
VRKVALNDSVADTLRQTLGDDPNLKDTIFPEASASLSAPSDAAGVELLSVIGEGGMAQVHLARQNVLNRQVAVKMLRPGQRGRQMAQRLLQEAWTTGALEHPNIVPVHDIILDDESAPQIVLKRVEGRSWSEVLSDPSQPPLEEQLRVLMDVSRAVEFAHHRGFVHRDIKPENVLVGDAGDVYLADWGIAVATEQHAGGRFPLAAEVAMIVGTPAYMAPEMLDPVNADIGPWTDIYLLGSVLYEILTRKPPHSGRTTLELVHNIARGPAMPDHEPELVRICSRAMQSDPDERFESAHQFRLALQDYLKHEGARAIAAKADDAFATWKKHRSSGDMMGADAAFAESRFGYRAALEAWPDFEHAETKLRDLDIEMVRSELDAGNLESARRIVARVTNPPARLLARVRSAEDEHLDTEQRRASLTAATDEATHRGTRAAMTAFLAGIWVFGPLLRTSIAEATPLGLTGPYVGSLALALAVVWVARRGIKRSYLNRAVTTIVLGIMLTDLALSLMAVRYDLGFLWLLQALPIVWATSAMIGVGLISPRFWPTALVMTLLCFGVRERPDWVNELTSLANLSLFLNAIWVNRGWSELQKRFSRTAA